MDASTVGQTYSTEELFGSVQSTTPKTSFTTEELWPAPAKTTEDLFPQLVAEKPDQATIERMRFVEKGVPFRPTDLGTIGTTAVK